MQHNKKTNAVVLIQLQPLAALLSESSDMFTYKLKIFSVAIEQFWLVALPNATNDSAGTEPESTVISYGCSLH